MKTKIALTVSLILLGLLLISNYSFEATSNNDSTLKMAILYKSQLSMYEQFRNKLKDININVQLDYIVDDTSMKKGDIWEHARKELLKKLSDGSTDLVAGVPADYIPYLIEHKKIVKLDELMIRDGINTNNLYKPVLDIQKKIGNGSIYALDPTFRTPMLVINKDLLDKLGVKWPENKVTWNEVIKICEEIKKKSVTQKKIVYPISLGPGAKEGFFVDFLVLSRPKELSLYDRDKDDVYPDMQEWQHTLTLFTDMFKFYGLNDAADSQFYRGKVAIKVMYGGELTKLYDDNAREIYDKDFNFEIHHMPFFPEDKEMTYVSLESNIMISSQSNKKELAWKVIKYAISKEYALDCIQTKQCSFEGDFMTFFSDETLNAYKKIYPGLNIEEMYSYGTKGPFARDEIFYDFSKYTTLEKLNSKYFYRILEGEINPKQALELIKKEME